MFDGANELARRERNKTALGEDSTTAAWVEEDRLFQNYKQLQFFDTLALYFHCTHDAARTEAHFDNVPLDRERDVTITLTPAAPLVYRLSPYPFAQDSLELAYQGRYLAPPEGEVPDPAELMGTQPVEEQVVRLIAA